MFQEDEESGEIDFFDELGELTESLETCWFAAGYEADFAKLMDSLKNRVQRFADRYVLTEG